MAANLSPESAVQVLGKALASGQRDLIRAALACAGDAGLDLPDLFSRLAAHAMDTPASPGDTKRASDALQRGLQWAGRYADAESLRRLAASTDAAILQAVPAGLAVTASIAAMDSRGLTPADVSAFRASRTQRATAAEDRAIVGLLRRGAIDDRAAWARMLDSGVQAVRELAWEGWQRLPADAPLLDTLLAALPEGAPSWHTLAALHRHRDEAAFTAMLALLRRHPSSDAFDWLATIGNEAAVSELVASLPRDPGHVARALEKAPRALVVPMLGRAYREDVAVRACGAAVVASVASVDGVPWLIDALSDPLRSVRAAAALALVSLGRSAVQPLLACARCSEEPARAHALFALATIGDPAAAHEMLEAAARGPRALRMAALKTLPTSAPDDAHDVLLPLLEAGDLKLRQVALLAIAELPSDAVIGALRRIAETDEPPIADVALEGLVVIAGGRSPWTAAATQALLDVVKTLPAERVRQAERVIRWLARPGSALMAALASALPQAEAGTGGGGVSLVRDLFIVGSVPEPGDLAPRRADTGGAGGGAPFGEYGHRRTADAPPITASMYLSASAPEVVAAGESCVVDIWCHAQAPAEFFERHQLSHALQRLRSQGPVPAAVGSSVQVRLEIPGLVVAEPLATLVWTGDVGVASFEVALPAGLLPGTRTGHADVSIDGLRVARVLFQLRVVLGASAAAAAHECTADVRRIESAFASYASEDRAAVLTRVQGMQKVLPDLDVFLDVTHLRSGDDWAQRLAHEIGQRDAFFLFWSRAASRSPWVEREWRLAAQTRGPDFIDPVPLEDPALAPPPAELAARHFNDWTLQLRPPPGARVG